MLFCKKFLEISENSQENTCARGSFLIKFLQFICELKNFKTVWRNS